MAEQRREKEAASNKEDAMRAMVEREVCEQAKHERERKEDLEREGNDSSRREATTGISRGEIATE